MPMLDAFIPRDALKPDAEAKLFKELTDLLLIHEGLDPANERAQAVSLVWIHRPEVFVAGAPSSSPRYRFIPSVPEGQYNDERRSAIVKGITEAVAKAEGSSFEEVGPRVWVFPNEIPDGRWGGRGVIRRLPEILSFIVGEDERKPAEQRLAQRRRETALALLAAARDAS